MPTHYVLIDYQNVQPSDLTVLLAGPFRVVIFIGEDRATLKTDLVLTLQKLGPRGELIQLTNQGPNALDFYITFYLGRLAEHDSTASFHILSKDKGFDPLIRHLKERRRSVTRSETLLEIPPLNDHLKQFAKDNLQTVVEYLKQRGKAVPATRVKLANLLTSLFKKQRHPAEIEALIHRMTSEKYITFNDNKVEYALPI